MKIKVNGLPLVKPVKWKNMVRIKAVVPNGTLKPCGHNPSQDVNDIIEVQTYLAQLVFLECCFQRARISSPINTVKNKIFGPH